MIIESLSEKLKTSETPVAQALHKGEHFKTIAIVFKKGMQLKEHKAGLPTTLLLIKGLIVYRQGSTQKTLQLFDEFEIPVNTPHSVEALEDSICILMQG